MGRYVYVKEKKTKPFEPGHWSEKKKQEAVCLWVAGTPISEIAVQLNVPVTTLYGWRSMAWWKDIAADLRSEDTQRLDAKLTKILDKSLEAIQDRLESGEFIYDQKTGKVKRTPVKLRDATVAMNTVLDKRQLIRKEPTKIVEQSNTAQQLQNLAAQFASFVTGQQAKPKLEELVSEFIDSETVVKDETGSYVIKE